jgi:drug/metabolite transporter (DMT)-like permease
MPGRASVLTMVALVAFAANSLLCRLALGGEAIDPYAFTFIRIASGAAMLALLVGRGGARGGGSFRDAFWLVLYAVPFSVAYLWLHTGTGALLLFGAVQLTLVLFAIGAGERPSVAESLGFVGASAGLVYLVAPGLTAPDPLGAASMVIAGAAWGLYTAAGKRGGDPLRRTAGNFARATLLLAPLGVFAALHLGSITPRGVVLAVVSGALASALGYVAWFAALHHLTATRAALVQLVVPVLAALGGVIFLGEPVTARLLVAGSVVLGSLAFAVRARARGAARPS